MSKSKSLSFVSEDEAKQQGETNLLKKIKNSCNSNSISMIRVSFLIGFMLLLILANVDFTGNAYATTITTTTAITTTSINEFQNLEDILKINSARSLQCSANDCHITCANGTIENLNKEIESLAARCDQGLAVRLEYCEFSAGSMNAQFFTGNYSLKSLIIYACELAEIAANTFKQASVTDLTNITFIKTNINSLNELTFLGLNSLKYFTMINNKINTTFNGVGFLEPISETIAEVVVQQLSDKNKKDDPTNWLKCKRDLFKLLNVDLSGNVFHDTLTSATFANLVQVQRLNLSNSYINTIEFGTFDKIIKTLSYLDLCNNQLTTLSGAFLAGNSMTGFHMALHNNAWNCDCANYELVKFIRKQVIEFTEEPKCTTPDELKDINIKLISIYCEDETTKAEILPPYTTEETKITAKTTQVTMSTRTSAPNKTTQYTEPEFTDESDQTDESSNTNESVETTSETTPTTTTISITTTTTTTPPPTPSKPEYLIKCATGETSYPVYFTVNQYDELFSIELISSTSVRLIRNDLQQYLNLIYFTPNAKYTQIFNNDSSEYVDDLTTNVDYVFCLISHGVDEISPFNCRSQHLTESPKEAWLSHSDTALFISLSVFFVALCIVFGIAVIYWTLRWRPAWLKGNKRLMKISSMSNEVFLLPKDAAEQQYIYSELAKTTSVDCLNKDTYNYIQCFQNLELFRLNKNAQYLTESLPPFDHAPSISRSKRQALEYPSTQPTKCSEDLMQQQLHNDDYYEEIY